MIPLAFLVMLIAQPIYELDEIVVTATRYPAALQDIALAIIVIDREELDNFNTSSIADVLQSYAGTDTKDYGIPGTVSSISIRGIPSTGTLVLVNGHPLNSITVGMADLSALNLNTVERIEIVKGPVSSFYGANGIGGAVNIITTKDYTKPELKMSFYPSTTDIDIPLQSREFFAKLGLPAGRMIFDIAATYGASDGFRENSKYTGYYLTGSLGYRLDNVQLLSTLAYNNKEYGLPGPMLIDSTSSSMLDHEKDENLLADLHMTWDISESFSLNNTFFADRRFINFHTGYVDLSQDTLESDYDYLTYVIGINTIAHFKSGSTDLTIGIDTHYDTLETTETHEQSRDTVWNASSYNIGAWFEFKYRIKHIILAPSLRYDRNSRFGSFLSPGIGFISPLIDNLWMKLSVGKAFRAPTFNDLFWPNAGNPDLLPEHGWAYELRFESSPSPTLFAALSLFTRSINDRIAWLPGEDNMWQPENVNHISVRGVDIEMNKQINDFTDIYLEGSYLQARQRNNEIVYDFYDWVADTSRTIIEEVERDAAFTPRYSASARLHFSLPYGYDFNIEGLYVAEQVNYYVSYDEYPDITMDTKTLDSYVLLNTGFSKKFFNHLRLSVGAKNLLDKAYAKQFGNSMSDLDYPMPGRIFFARISMDY
ncbi:MAG: TonB-dependent receptor [bacterium]